MQDKVALVGTRSGIAAASALNVLRSLKMHQGLETFTRVVEYSLEMAKYFEQRLNEIYEPGEVVRKYFNVNFPRKNIPDFLVHKYLIQPNGTTMLQAMGLISLNRGLIDRFIEEVKQNRL